MWFTGRLHINYTRNKPKRRPLPKDLPRESIVHDIPDDEKICDCWGDDLHQMGDDKSEQLKFIPDLIKVQLQVLSQKITSKYQFSLPLYRQETLFKQHSIELNRKTMSEWMIKCATLFKPIIERLHEHLLQQVVI